MIQTRSVNKVDYDDLFPVQGEEEIEQNNNEIPTFVGARLDSLYAQAVYICSYARQYGHTDILSGVEDIVRVARELLEADVDGRMPEVDHILGMEFAELRYVAQNPQEELGVQPHMPTEYAREMTALLNLLRTQIREVEFSLLQMDQSNEISKQTQTILNHLVGAAYILMLESQSVDV